MEPVKFITSQAISQDEIIDFLAQIGIQRQEGPDRTWDYIIQRPDAIVWIDLDNPEEHYPDPEVDALIESKLGGPPQTSIVLYTGYDPGSEPLALKLAIQFAERWPFVLDNLSGLARRIFVLEELQDLHEKGLGLHEDEKGVPLPKEWYTLDGEDDAPCQIEELEKEDRELLEQVGLLWLLK